MVGSNTSQVDPSKVPCRDHEKPEGCKFGDLCKFFHDPARVTLKVTKSEDCGFWMEGSWKYDGAK